MKARSERPYRIGIDFTSLDHMNLGNGQYRYVVDLVRGLVSRESRVQFVLFGSNQLPVPELRDITGANQLVQYRFLPRLTFRGTHYINHVRYSLIAKAERIDLWHAVHSFIPAMLGCSLVATEYDLMMELFPEYKQITATRPYRLYYSLLRRKAQAILCISDTTRSDLIRIKRVSANRAKTVFLGTRFESARESRDAEDFLAQYPELRGSPWIASPYNLEPRKNLAGMVRAFARLAPDYPGLKLLLFGRAAWSEQREREFQQLISSLGIGDRVVLTNHVDDATLLCIYQQCTLFVFPSLYEGFGLPLVEAMAQGACTVARNASAMREIVGEAGALVETAEVDGFAREIGSLLKDEHRRAALSSAAKCRAQSFTVSRMAAQTLHIYKQVLSIGCS